MWLGKSIALLSAMTFALNLTLASLCYSFGATPHTVNCVRSIVFILAITLLLRLLKVSLRLTRKQFLLCAATGCLMCAHVYAMLIAIELIPVGLAVVVMYTYPLLIAVFTWLTGRETVSFLRALALLLALFGIWLVANSPAALSQIFGLTCAGIGAITLASILIVSERAMSEINPKVVMFYMMAITAIVASIVTIGGIQLDWPSTVAGWATMGGTAIFFVVGTFSLFTAVSLAGPLLTAIIDNSAPVWAILFGYIILDESLSTSQWTGSLVVIGSVLFMQIIFRNERSKYNS